MYLIFLGPLFLVLQCAGYLALASSLPSSVSHADGFNINLSVTNNGGESMVILVEGTPFDGYSLDGFVEISCDGNTSHQIEFLGPFISFDEDALTLDDFSHLEPGSSLSATVDISKAFDLHAVSCSEFLQVSVMGVLEVATLANDSVPNQIPSRQNLNTVILDPTSIKIPIDPEDLKRRYEEASIQARYLVFGSHSCSTSRLNAIDEAFVWAGKLARNAASYLSSLTTSKKRSFVTKYFGPLGPANARWLAARYRVIAEYATKYLVWSERGYNKEPVYVSCRDRDGVCLANKNALAYAYKPLLQDYHLIVMCPLVFSKPIRTTVCQNLDQGGTALHELGHTRSIFGPFRNLDHAYDMEDIVALSSDKRLVNARSYEYFALGVETCNS